MTMEVLWGAETRPDTDRPTVVTVGMFDGVHLGHVALHQRVLERAQSIGGRAAVVSFDPHPLEVLAPDKAPCLLTTLDQRLRLFEEVGFDLALVLRFDAELASLTPEEFAKATFVEGLNVRNVVVGEDFRFGHGRAGDIGTLRELGDAFGFEVESVPLITDRGGKVSSSTVRICLAESRVEEAADLLGRPFRLAGTVVGGDRRGRELGFPTANLAPHTRACLPGFGVYAGWWVEGDERRAGVINVGVRPTFHDADVRPLCEIHVFGFDGDLYGHDGEVEFTAYLRPEERFETAEALVAQMEQDARQARSRLRP